MRNYPWPGNIRELKNNIERLVVTRNDVLVSKAVMQQLLGISGPAHTPVSPSPAPVLPNPGSAADLNLRHAKEDLKISYIREALSQFNSKRQAAKALGLDHSTLVLKCQKYGI